MISERVRSAVGYAVDAGALSLFVLIALVERAVSTWRRLRGARPRLLWGPSAVLNNKYWSEAMQGIGYESRTCILVDSAVTRREDWDVRRDDFLGKTRFAERLRSYAMFAWAIRHADVFLLYFDGGYLRGTRLEWQEFRLLHLAGKKLVFSPYGGDIAVLGHLGALEEPLLADYPQLPEISDLLKRRVLHSLRWADVSLLTMQPGFQPWFNAVWANQLAIDTSLWHGDGRASDRDGRNGAVYVVHAPNHREFKGTAHLERSVRSLRAEGLEIELRILEGVPNEEVRPVVLDADIVADQFLAGWGLFAVEGMAAGKPVLSNLDSIPELFQATEDVKQCPIVNTSPEQLTDHLRRLVTSPRVRGELGRASLEYARRYHSYDAVAEGWKAVVEFAWRGTPLPERFLPPVRTDGAHPAKDARPRGRSCTTARS
jgi:glycosyltransferase involved in cell wall biosynthesis